MGAAILDAGVGKLTKSVSKANVVFQNQALTFSALSCVFGFLLLMRFLSERIASLGCTVLDLMTSEISRLSAMSSLKVDASQLPVLPQPRRRVLKHHTGCCSWPSLSAHPGQCLPLTTTTPSCWLSM